MAWLRLDDSQILDGRIGSLTDNDYRAHAALVQYVGRNHRDSGAFHRSEIAGAIYATPRRPKSVKPSQLELFEALGLVESVTEYTPEELEIIDLDCPIRDGWLRIHRWELYQPPRDTTAAERKRRQRARDSHRAVTRDQAVTGVTRARNERTNATNERDISPKAVDLDATANGLTALDYTLEPEPEL